MGNRARMLLARAMAVNPDVLIADGGRLLQIWTDAAWDMMLCLMRSTDRGKTLIIATHTKRIGYDHAETGDPRLVAGCVGSR